MAAVAHDALAQLEDEHHAESAEGNLPETHSDTSEQHEAAASDTDGAPEGDHSANGAHPDDSPEAAMEAETGGEAGDIAAPGKDASPASPTKPKVKSSLSVKPAGSPASAPTTPTVKKACILSNVRTATY